MFGGIILFTGIIESLGTVKNIVRASHSFSIEIQSDFNEKLVLGESIAVNGVCLTEIGRAHV